jgi:hypothetical protein
MVGWYIDVWSTVRSSSIQSRWLKFCVKLYLLTLDAPETRWSSEASLLFSVEKVAEKYNSY